MGDAEALRRGAMQVIDVRSLPPGAEVDALLGSGVEEYMVVPMIAGGELIGALSFGGPRGVFSSEQINIAQEVAAQLAIGIAQARLYEQVKRQTEELERRVQERTAELLERVVAGRPGSNPPPISQALARFFLAQALWDARLDRPRTA